MADERAQLLKQVLDLQAELSRLLRPAREWLEVDLTMSQFKVLFLLYTDGSASMGQLAGSLGVTLSTVTGIVDRLVEHGVVQREEHPQDRRLVLCRLTSQGFDTVEGLYEAGRNRFRALVEDLSPSDLRTVVDGLAVLQGAAHRLVAAEADVEPATARANGCASRARSNAVLIR
jgi:DNA-binding MarR family transcriptional regulator